MIESISIASVATYATPPEILTGLSQFNYLFGANGTGKMTVSRIIANELNFPSCSVTWKGGTKLQPMVYNHDFVEKNFNQSTELKGVFTLGEEQVDTLAKIASTKVELDALTKKIENLTHQLQGDNGNGGKKGELAKLELKLQEKIWTQKRKLDGKHVRSAFIGYLRKPNFKDKVFEESSSNTAALLTLEELEKRAESLFGQTPIAEVVIPVINTTALLAHETNPILKKRVVGKGDVDIAAMITKLGNSDWVREGRIFYEINDCVCPFCQRITPETFTQSLNEYFDETFKNDTNAIADVATRYAVDSYNLQQQVAAIIAASSKFLDVEKLKIEKELLDTKIALNIQRLAEKKKEASQIIELESLSHVVAAITSLIDSANTQISTHNSMVANLATERATLTAQVWRFVLEELKADIEKFRKEKSSLDSAIAGMTASLEQQKEKKSTKEAEIRELEKQTTSIQPTIDGINQLLSSFGFLGFKLAKAANGTSYKLVRSDGSDAKSSLSEGEKTFITFLYFYHLLKGSESESGITTDRVVVFDDPVSSLDSDILFIVSTLIRGLIDEVRGKNSHIKQIFVLTHNVYFHKEVTFDSNRKNQAMNEKTFWIIRKPGMVSKIEKYATNPIKTSYELLWAEVRKPDRSNLTIQNTLRRILENYFKILGGIEFDKLCEMFEGREKTICKSLCSWIQDGSHYAHDDLYVSIDDTTVDTYLKVFRAIFDKSRHSAHYEMMMGADFEPASLVSNET